MNTTMLLIFGFLAGCSAYCPVSAEVDTGLDESQLAALGIADSGAATTDECHAACQSMLPNLEDTGITMCMLDVAAAADSGAERTGHLQCSGVRSLCAG